MPEHTSVDLLRDLALIMVLGAVATLIFHRLRQPVILGYLVAGVVVSPFTPPPFFVHDPATISSLADFGIILLMFSLGAEFSVSKLRKVGTVAVIGGAIQVLIVFALGYRVGLLLGWGDVTSLVLGCALSISSTAVIVKLFQEQRRLDEPASQAVIGILVFEDFAAIVMIAVLSGLGATGQAAISSVGPVLVDLVLFLAVALVLGRTAVPWLFARVESAGRQEIHLISALGLCFAMAMFSRWLGLSVAAGAFVAGAMVAESGRGERLAPLVAPVRDMFAALFFVAIGMLFDPSLLGEYWPHILLFTALLIAGKVVAGTTATFLLGYNHRAALQAGLSLAQIGEFSLIIVKVGQDSGAVPEFLYAVVVGVTILSTLTTPYLMRSASVITARIEGIMPTTAARTLAAVEATLDQVRAGGVYRIGFRAAVQKHFTGAVAGLLLFTVVVAAARVAYEQRESLSNAAGVSVLLLVGLLLTVVALVGVAALSLVVYQVRRFTFAAARQQVREAIRLRKVPSMALALIVSRNAALLVIVAVVVVILELFLPAATGLRTVPLLVLAGGFLIAAALMWDSVLAINRRLSSTPGLPDDGGESGPSADGDRKPGSGPQST